MKNKKFLLGLLFSFAVIGYILVKLDWRAVGKTFSTLDWKWLIMGFGVYLINYFLRSYRFKTLLQLDYLKFSQLMGATSLYGMYVYLLPAKSGELSYPIILKRNFNIALTESTATLIAARFFDFATIALFIPFVMVIYWEQLPSWFIYSCLLYCGCVGFFGTFIVLLIRRSNPIKFNRKKINENRWMKVIVDLLENLLTNLRVIDQRRQYWQLWSVTISIWFLVYTNFYLIVLSMGYKVSYFQMIVVSIFMVPMTLLPFQGFANLGTHEIGWVAAFSIFGQNTNTSLAIAVSSHIIMLFFVLTLGLFGIILLKMVRSSSIPEIK